MAGVFLIAFLTLPLVEITLFIVVGNAVGLGVTVGLVLLTTLGGAGLLRYLGFTALQRLQENLARQEYPEVELFNAVCLFAAAVLLIVPGFFTDTLGIVLFIPVFRNALRRVLFHHLVSSGGVFTRDGAPSSAFRNEAPGWHYSPHGDDVIEGEFEDLTPNEQNEPKGKEPGPNAPSLTDDHEGNHGEKETGGANGSNGIPPSS